LTREAGKLLKLLDKELGELEKKWEDPSTDEY